MIELLPLTITKLGGSLFASKELDEAGAELLIKCLNNYDDTIEVAPRPSGRQLLQKVRKIQGEELQRESDV